MDWKRNRFGEIEEWEYGMPLEKGDDIYFEWSNHVIYRKGEKRKENER